MKPQVIQIGNRILNLAQVQYMVVQGPNLVDVYLAPNQDLIQYAEGEAGALLATLDAGYTAHVLTEAEVQSESS
jgi:hypothetical protein